jgi:riboflavin transporter 2
VLYLPFMARFQEIYLTPYFIGEGLSGFVPSLIALGQGVGGNPECRNKTDGSGIEAENPDPRFSISTFFYFLFAFTVLSAIAFYLLNVESVIEGAKNSSRGSESPSSESKGSSSRDGSVFGDNSVFELPRAHLGLNSSPEGNNAAAIPPRSYRDTSNESNLSNESSLLLGGISKSTFVSLLTLLAFTCFLANGVFPSITSYSALPYGNVVYHLAVTLSTMANPAVCFLGLFLPPASKRSIYFMAVLSILVSGYVMATAVMSPSPPLVGETSGETLLVRCNFNN